MYNTYTLPPLTSAIFIGFLFFAACRTDQAEQTAGLPDVDSLLAEISPTPDLHESVPVAPTHPDTQQARKIQETRENIVEEQVGNDPLCKLNCDQILARYRAGVEYAKQNNNDFSKLSEFTPESPCWNACRKKAAYSDDFDALEIQLNESENIH